MNSFRNVADYWIFPNGESITESLQALLDEIGPEVEETIYFPPGEYLLEAAGVLVFNGANNAYCVKIPSNTKIVLHPQATIKLANGANASIFMNDGISGEGNTNISISGGSIDGNRENQSGASTGSVSGIQMHNVYRLKIENMRFFNMYDYATYCLGIYDSRIANLYCEDSRGSGFKFGNDYETDGANARVQSSYFDNIKAFNCEGIPGQKANGNPFIFVGDDCYIGRVEGSFSINGIKIQNNTRNCHFNSLYAKGNTSDRGAGIKIQGGQNMKVSKCSFGTLQAESCGAQGVYIYEIEDCSIGQIITDNCGRDTRRSNVQIGGEISRINIESIVSDSAVNHGIEFHATNAKHINVGAIVAKNSSQTSRGNNSNVEVWGENISIGRITSMDNQIGAETVRHGLMIRSGSSNIDIDVCDVVGEFVGEAVRVDSQDNIRIKTLRVNGDQTVG